MNSTKIHKSTLHIKIFYKRVFFIIIEKYILIILHPKSYLSFLKNLPTESVQRNSTVIPKSNNINKCDNMFTKKKSLLTKRANHQNNH